MNKRKVLSILLLALITVTLAVSCSGSIDAPAQDAEELAYVTFGNGHSRELGTSYETLPYDDLYWFYIADKDDNYGTTGETLAEKPVIATYDQGTITAIDKGLSGRVGPFSQGKWIFTLKAYSDLNENKTGKNLVYEGTTKNVTLKGGDVKNVPVSVSLKGDYGKVSISNVKFYWANGGGVDSPVASLSFVGSNSSNKFTVTASSLTYVEATTSDPRAHFKLSVQEIPRGDGSTTTNIPADYYTVTAKVYLPNSEDTPLVTQTFGLRVYGNTTTVITGDLTEGLDSYVLFDVAKQDMKVFVPSSTGTTKIENINVVPDTTTVTDVTKSTTVEFDEGALTSVADKTLQLDVKVTTVEAANNKFNISGTTSGNKSAFAGIDVTLWATDTTGSREVNTFTQGKYATVTTYIATGLSNVSVHYTPKANDPENIKKDYTIGTAEQFNSGSYDGYYDSQTGKLVFNTNHFSEFYVLADCVALNVNKNIGYKDLVEAINSANSGDTIELYRHVNLTSALLIDKSIVIDGNGHNISNTANRVIRITQPNLNVELYNLGVISKCTAGSDVRGISFDDVSSGSSLLLDRCTVSASYYAINIVPGPSNLDITIKNGTVAAGWAAINSYSNNSTFTIENSILKGLNDKGESKWNNFATIVFDGDGLKYEDNIGKYGSGNTMTIKNSTVYASSESSNHQAWLSIQYGARDNHITLDNETRIIDENGIDQSNVIFKGKFVGRNENELYSKSYDVHSQLTVGTETINICYHGEEDSTKLVENGVHVPYGFKNAKYISSNSTQTYQSDTMYYLAPGEYGDFSVYLHGLENVGFTAKEGAIFNKVEIGYHAGQDSSLSAKQNSTLTIKGFNVDGHLFIHAADQKVVIEGNTAAQISLKTYQFEDMNIQVINNTLTGGSDTTKAPQQYGLYIVPNKTNYNLMISGNTFRGISKHAIGVQGQGDGSAETAANSIIVQNNTFESYGLDGKDGRAAFKIWEDTKYAPTEKGNITEYAHSLVQSIKDGNNTYNNLGAKCVLGNFYDTLVPFNE